MYIVTNRELDEENNPIFKFGTGANAKGISELRLATAAKVGSEWKVDVIPEKRNITANTSVKLRPSYQQFRALQKRMMERKRNCVFFVHGYNTNIRSAIETAHWVERLYNVEVILFTWPSRGGGEGKRNIGKDLIGTASYKRDKRIAQESIGALDRCLEMLSSYITESSLDCGQRFNLLCHSMGNYLLKNLLKSSIYQGETLIFDNIILCAADVNNAGHVAFVDRIAHRRRVYITINENDFALAWSRRKLGEAQKARLGHFSRNLDSDTSIYLDVTDAQFVDDSHGYFADKSAQKNPSIRSFFNDVLNGERGERNLPGFDLNKKVYSIV